ncbi:MAG TPA: hypothetical protein VJ720_01525 [Chitinophaga sp.]|nr:hypothetical protein [Chitinophaga sp.]
MALKRYKPFNRISARRLASMQEKKELIQKDHDFFMEIWEERDGRCEVTGEFLGEPLSTMFHHLLPKADYPQYRYCKWNILLVKPDIHAMIESDISKVPMAQTKTRELLQLWS